MNKEKVIKRMNQMHSLIPGTIKAIKELPDFPFCSLSNVVPPGEIQIDIDEYDYIKYLKLRRALNINYTYLGHWYHSGLNSFFVEFKHKKLDIRLDVQLKQMEQPNRWDRIL